MTKTELSVVVPLYNEDSNINILYKELKEVLQKLNKEYEIIFVDDGSTDKSHEKLQEIYNSSEHVKIIKFRRNFGQSAAICAGFFNSKGEVIIVMDADLQNDPRDIPKLLDKLNEGYDLVSGWRFNRNDPFLKRLSSKLANWMHKKLTGLKIHDSGCTLKAYKRESIKNLNLFGEMHRYIPALISLKGFKISEIKVNHRSRKYGRTKYGMSRLVHGFLDLLYIKFWSEFSTRPLHFFGYLGIIPIILGIIIGIVKAINLVILFLNNEPVVVAPLLLFSVFLIIVGILFIIFGFLAEMNVMMNYSQTNQQKYEIEKILSKS